LISERILKSTCRDKNIESWTRYCSTLSYETRLSNIWRVARRFRNPGANPSMGQDPEIWLPRFASRIAPKFVPPGLDLPEIGSERLSWLTDPLSFDELEAALDLCYKSCPGLDGLRFFRFKALPSEAKLCLLNIYNDILRTSVVP
jgi:hypothetical protein